jgi:hypothetical protein
MDRIIYICNGNPGALSVFRIIIEKYHDKLDDIIIKLENNNITGSDIWIIYKSLYKNIDLFIDYDFDNYKV